MGLKDPEKTLPARPLRVGIIGAGWVATARHIPSYRRHRAAKLVAVFDRTRERAEDVGQRVRIPRACSRLDEFFDQNLDVVSICTPPWTHAELAIQALECGAHVFTEKPMAMNASEATRMVDASVTADRLLCVSHNFLFSKSVQRADALRSKVGPVRYVLGLQLSSPRRRLPEWYRQLPAGLMFDESPHMFYTLQHFLGPLELQGLRSTGGLRETPETIEVQVTGASSPGMVVMHLTAPLSEWHVTLVQDRGVVDLDLFRDILIRLPSDEEHRPRDVLRTSRKALVAHALGFASSGTRYVTHNLFWGHDVLIRRFVDAVLSGGPAPVSPADSVSVVRLMDSVLAEFGLP